MPNLGNEATVAGTDVWLTPPRFFGPWGISTWTRAAL
jgi:hypothetical protein